ncbi:MAG: hypothetical protein JW893_08430, partial [Candidatus Omnitrophica bacterium]|nr:hypothetical protein [Candidatus Omnitrophota bacterium]
MVPGPKKNEGRRTLAPLEIGLLVILWFMSFAFGAVHSWSLMAALAGLFFLLIFYPERLREAFRLPRFLQLTFSILLVYLILQSNFLSANRYVTTLETFKWVAFACLFLVVVSLPVKSIHRLAIGIILLGVFQSAYGLFEVLSGSDKVLGQAKGVHAGFVSGSYFNRNHLAGLLELCLGLQIGYLFWAFWQHKFWAGLFSSLGFLLMMAAFVKTGSRTATLSFMGALGLLCFLIPRRKYKASILFYLLLGIFISIGLYVGRDVLSLRFLQLTDHIKT